MPASDPRPAGEQAGPIEEDLRQRIARALTARLDPIASDTAAMLAHSGGESFDAAYRRQIGRQVCELLASAVRDGGLEGRGRSIADLRALAVSRALTIERLFTSVYLVERAALDELALDAALGATTEFWPAVAQHVRRASFDLLAAYVERAQLEPDGRAILDPLTTLYTRPLFDAVVSKELERAARAGHPVSLVLLDVDRLSAINVEHGHGVGDKILERLGILLHGYFRQHDWVARYADDSFAVLLTRTAADRASELAERLRLTIEERLGFVDHLTDRPVAVSVSGAVVNLAIEPGAVVDIDRLMAEADLAVQRAKRQGRNRIERADVTVPALPGRPLS